MNRTSRSGLMAVLLAACALPAGVQAAPTQHYWYDGTTRRPLYLDDSQRAEFGDGTATKSAVLKSGGVPAKAAGSGPQAKDTTTGLQRVSPVFRDQPGGAERALPGGIIVTLRQAMPADQARTLLEAQGLQPVRPIGDGSTMWLVAADPGLPSLELANRLHESGVFQSAAPNWWQHRARK